MNVTIIIVAGLFGLSVISGMLGLGVAFAAIRSWDSSLSYLVHETALEPDPKRYYGVLLGIRLLSKRSGRLAARGNPLPGDHNVCADWRMACADDRSATPMGPLFLRGRLSGGADVSSGKGGHCGTPLRVGAAVGDSHLSIVRPPRCRPGLSLVAMPHSPWRGAQTRRGYKRRRRYAALVLGPDPAHRDDEDRPGARRDADRRRSGGFIPRRPTHQRTAFRPSVKRLFGVLLVVMTPFNFTASCEHESVSTYGTRSAKLPRSRGHSPS